MSPLEMMYLVLRLDTAESVKEQRQGSTVAQGLGARKLSGHRKSTRVGSFPGHCFMLLETKGLELCGSVTASAGLIQRCSEKR